MAQDLEEREAQENLMTSQLGLLLCNYNWYN